MLFQFKKVWDLGNNKRIKVERKEKGKLPNLFCARVIVSVKSVSSSIDTKDWYPHSHQKIRVRHMRLSECVREM